VRIVAALLDVAVERDHRALLAPERGPRLRDPVGDVVDDRRDLVDRGRAAGRAGEISVGVPTRRTIHLGPDQRAKRQANRRMLWMLGGLRVKTYV
jgi:hypothetical protein